MYMSLLLPFPLLTFVPSLPVKGYGYQQMQIGQRTSRGGAGSANKGRNRLDIEA
jgi:hypothetical protein